MPPKDADRIANSAVPCLDLHCLLGLICQKSKENNNYIFMIHAFEQTNSHVLATKLQEPRTPTDLEVKGQIKGVLIEKEII